MLLILNFQFSILNSQLYIRVPIVVFRFWLHAEGFDQLFAEAPHRRLQPLII